MTTRSMSSLIKFELINDRETYEKHNDTNFQGSEYLSEYFQDMSSMLSMLNSSQTEKFSKKHPKVLENFLLAQSFTYLPCY